MTQSYMVVSVKTSGVGTYLCFGRRKEERNLHLVSQIQINSLKINLKNQAHILFFKSKWSRILKNNN